MADESSRNDVRGVGTTGGCRLGSAVTCRVEASRWRLPLASLRQDFRRPRGLQAIALRRQIIQETRI
jgi:hypothetical protein